LSLVRRCQSGVGRGPRLRPARMTPTFQNGREQPTTCISGFFFGGRNARNFCNVVENSPNGLLLDSSFSIFHRAEFRMFAAVSLALLLIPAFLTSPMSGVVLSSHASCPLVGRGASSRRGALSFLVYKHIFFGHFCFRATLVMI
jgi:hypothetical protein